MFNLLRFGNYITDLRNQAGYTQRQVAEWLGVSPQAVSNWERGETFPTVELLTEIAKIYQVNLIALVRSAELSQREESIVKEIAQASPDEIAAMIREGRLSAQEMLSCSPFLKHSTISIICAELQHFGLNISYLALLHEFILSEEYVHLVANSDFNVLDKRVLRQFCRFVDTEDLFRLFTRVLDGEFDWEYAMILLQKMPYLINRSLVEAAVLEGGLPEFFLGDIKNYPLSIDSEVRPM